MTLHYKVTWHV